MEEYIQEEKEKRSKGEKKKEEEGVERGREMIKGSRRRITEEEED